MNSNNRSEVEYLLAKVAELEKSYKNLEHLVEKQGGYLNNIQKDMSDNED